MMHYLSLTFCLTWYALLGAVEFTPTEQAELKQLQGSWKIVSTERNGMRENNPPEPVLVKIEGEKLLLGGKEVGLTISLLSVETKPKLINISHVESKKVIEAIYELEEDRWRICLNTQVDGAPERPTGFETANKANFITVILQREK